MEPMQDRTDSNIGEYIAILRRRWLVIAGTMVLVVSIVAALDFSKTRIYEASSQLLLQPKQSESIFSPAQSSVDPTRAVQNELKIINSLAVRTAVAKAYGEKISISAVSGGDDDVIILSATDSNPKDAARKVNVYAETYQTERFNAIVDDLTQSKLVLQQQIDDFQVEIDAINKPLAALDEKLAKTPTTDPTYDDLSAERDRLDQQIQVRRADMENQLSDYQQRLQVLQLSERLTTTGGVQILNPATVPSSPISPNVVRDLIQAALIGLFLGIGLALLLEQVDDSIRSPGDLERVTKGIPTLGLIPLDEGWKNKDEPRLTTQAAPMSATAEAYRGLRTTLQYLALHRPMGIVQVTSASAHEGKTSTMANLAIAFAEAGMPVAVVGCDLRRPRAQSFLQVDGAIGLTSVLLGEVPLEVALQQSPIHPNIRVLPSGPRPPNPSELLSLDRTSELIQSLLDNHSIVFLDCPPVLPVTDSLVLSRCVDASLFIAKANSTSKRDVKRSLERLTQVNNPLVGTILNGVDAEGAYGSLYDYYGYSKESRSRFLPKMFKRTVPDVPKLDEAVLPGMENGPTAHGPDTGDHIPGPAPINS
ncbi:MAG: polysaccharide biosynthesis tyrosine autokinase [Microthrixaceae bacterium]